jgi:hypothetical protein
MNLFAPTHPKKYLQTATGLARATGVICLVGAGLPLLFAFGSIGDSPRAAVSGVILAGVVIITLVAPGVLYLVFAPKIERQRRWAVITVLALACVHVALCLVYLILGLVFGAPIDCSFLACGVLLLAAALLVIHSAKALAALRSSGYVAPGPRGFEPKMRR